MVLPNPFVCGMMQIKGHWNTTTFITGYLPLVVAITIYLISKHYTKWKGGRATIVGLHEMVCLILNLFFTLTDCTSSVCAYRISTLIQETEIGTTLMMTARSAFNSFLVFVSSISGCFFEWLFLSKLYL
jgi:hypothetical protein